MVKIGELPTLFVHRMTVEHYGETRLKYIVKPSRDTRHVGLLTVHLGKYQFRATLGLVIIGSCVTNI